MKVSARKLDRTIVEMDMMWQWMTDNFGPPIAHNKNLKRWTYGKEYLHKRDLVNGTWDIEWFEFHDEKDAMLFMLRWG